MRFALCLLSQLIEQVLINVIAYTDGGDGHLLRQRIPFEARKIFLRARRRDTVGKQNDVLVGGLLFCDGLERGIYGLLNLRATVGANLIDQIAFRIEILRGSHRYHPLETFVE